MMASLSTVSVSQLASARTKVSAELDGAAAGDQAGDRDEAAVARGEFVAFPVSPTSTPRRRLGPLRKFYQSLN